MEKSSDALRTISEVAIELDVPKHVLRFWETKFTQVSPMKRGGGRRYYRPSDITLLKGIQKLLYREGFTIRGVQQILKREGINYVKMLAEPPEEGEQLTSRPSNSSKDQPGPPLSLSKRDQALLRTLLEEIKVCQSLIRQ